MCTVDRSVVRPLLGIRSSSAALVTGHELTDNVANNFLQNWAEREHGSTGQEGGRHGAANYLTLEQLTKTQLLGGGGGENNRDPIFRKFNKLQ